MVQTYQAPIRVYHYPFEEVMKAYELRFPSCELIPLFADSEIIEDKYETDSISNQHIRITKRRCRLKVDVPYLLKKIIGMEYVDFIQTNRLDHTRRTLSIEAYNESFATRVKMSETCSYSVHPQNSDWTCFEQDATLNIMSFFNFESILEKVVIKHYISSVSKGKEILLHHIHELGIDKKHQISCTGKGDDATTAKNMGTVNKQQISFSSRSFPHNDNHHLTSRPILGDEESSSPFSLKRGGDGNCILLSQFQQSQLLKLKILLKERLNLNKLPNDTHLFRFIKARDFNIDKAYEMLYASLTWRKHHQIDKIISLYKTPTVVLDYFPGGWLIDHTGRPIYHVRLGEMDVKGLYGSLGMDGIIKHVLYVCEQGFELCKNVTRKCDNYLIIKSNPDDSSTCSSRNSTFSSHSSYFLNPGPDPIHHNTLSSLSTTSLQISNPIHFSSDMGKTQTCPSKGNDLIIYDYSWRLLLDMRNVGVKHLWTPGIRALVKIIETVEANYPETLNCLWVLGAPKVLFPVIWTMVSPMIDEKTREKFHFIPRILNRDVVENEPLNYESDDDLFCEADDILSPQDVKASETIRQIKNDGEAKEPPDDLFNCFGFLSSSSSVSSNLATPTMTAIGGDIIPQTISTNFNLLNILQSQTLNERTYCSSHKNCPDLEYLLNLIKSSDSLQNSVLNSTSEKLVPKSYYLNETVLNTQKNSVEEDIYQNCNLSKGQYHEVIIYVKEVGTVITWDFDVAKQDCSFKLIWMRNFKAATYQSTPLVVEGKLLQSPTDFINENSVALPSNSEITSSTSTFKQFLTRKNSLSSGNNKHILNYDSKINAHVNVGFISVVLPFDKNVGENKNDDHFRNPIVLESQRCKEGESRQGSHYSNIHGYYILQWYVPPLNITSNKANEQQPITMQSLPSSNSSSPLVTSNNTQSFLSPIMITNSNFDFDFTTLSMNPKCKISYYFKVISPEQYRIKSFASLPSMTSGFISSDDTSLLAGSQLSTNVEVNNKSH